jgi:protoporphyrin/coproporphyrin ferrochelatase
MSEPAGERAVLLVSHGTVESLDDLPEFLKNIRRGREAPPELVAEVRHRYEAIGKKSPLGDICVELARRVEAELGVPTRAAMRLFRPTERDALTELRGLGARKIAVVPLAQLSAGVYASSAEEAAREVGVEVACAGNWGTAPSLVRGFAASLGEALEAVPEPARARAHVLFTAHSLPMSVVEGGDRYPELFRESAAAVAEAVGLDAERWSIAYQSQGMSKGPGGRPMVWLGPDLRTAFADLRDKGVEDVVVAPIGFLADHVEILYDLDIEALAWAGELGLRLHRASSLNASDDLVAALCALARPLLDAGGAPAP